MDPLTAIHCTPCGRTSFRSHYLGPPQRTVRKRELVSSLFQVPIRRIRRLRTRFRLLPGTTSGHSVERPWCVRTRFVSAPPRPRLPRSEPSRSTPTVRAAEREQLKWEQNGRPEQRTLLLESDIVDRSGVPNGAVHGDMLAKSEETGAMRKRHGRQPPTGSTEGLGKLL